MTPDAPQASDLSEALHKLRAILSAAQAQVTIALEEAAKVPAPPRAERVRCPVCAVERPKAALAEHLENVHGLAPDSSELTRDRVEVAGANGLATLAAGDDG